MVQLAPSFGLADMDPVGRTVTRAMKTSFFDEGTRARWKRNRPGPPPGGPVHGRGPEAGVAERP
jgi:hypothetical protein